MIHGSARASGVAFGWLLALGLFTLAGCDDGGPSGDGGTGGSAGGGGAPGAGGDAGPDDGCLADDDCTEGEYCRFADGAFEGECVPGCRLDPDDCEDGFRCDPDRRECVREVECEENDDCDDGAECVEGRCAPPEGCTVEPDSCPEGQVCDPDTRECVEPTPVVCCLPDAMCEQTTDVACEAAGGEARVGVAGCSPNPCIDGCRRDADCGDGEYCDTDTGACEAGCRQKPDDCGNARYCDPSHTCVEARCVADDDCDGLGGEFYCQTEVSACRRACEADDECPEGFECADDGRCVRIGCADDEAEDDDGADQARAVAFDEAGAAPPQAGRLCPLDDDWYAVELPEAGDRVRAELSCGGDAEAPDLALELVDADGRRVAGANEPGCGETLVWPGGGDPGAAGTFYVRVFGPAPMAGVDYDLRIARLPPADACDPDDAEEDDTPDAATELLIEADEETVEGRTACHGDDDWFRFVLGAGDGVVIDLTSLGNATGGNEDLTFDLVGPGAPALPLDPEDAAVFGPAESLPGPDGEEVLRLTFEPNNDVIAEGVWYLRVRGADPSQSGGYTLRVAAARAGTPCRPDAEEPNDAPGQATDLMAREGFAEGDALRPEVALTLVELSRCTGDADWFRFRAADGDRLTVRATLRGEDGSPVMALGGAVHLAVVDRGGVVVGVEARDVGPELNTVTPALAAGEYFVRVAGARAARALRYDLTLVRTPSGGACVDDAYDAIARNDERGAATPLDVGPDGPALVAGASLCRTAAGDDVDWYTFELEQAGRLTVELTFVHADGDLDLYLWRAGEDAPLAVGDSIDDDESLIVEGAPPGHYYLEVSSLAGDENDYDLTVTFDAAAACEADAGEPDDGPDDAVDAAPPFAAGERWICEQPADEDWYRVDVGADGPVTFHVDFFRDDDGWITLDVYDEDGGFVRSIEEPLDGQCVILEPQPGGATWFFAVVARTFDPADDTPDRVSYAVEVADGERCAEFEPLYLDVEWPRLP